MAMLSDVLQFIEQHQDVCDAGHPASDELIDKAEKFLKLRFPNEYREFLKQWGTLGVGPFEFYGICDGDFVNSSVPDAIWYTNEIRQRLRFPKELVITYDNNGDEYYCLDTSDQQKSRVVIWDVPSRQVRAVKAESVFDFILNQAADFF